MMKERRSNTNNEKCDREGKEEGKGVLGSCESIWIILVHSDVASALL